MIAVVRFAPGLATVNLARRIEDALDAAGLLVENDGVTVYSNHDDAIDALEQAKERDT